MKQREEILTMLNLMQEPAFCVEGSTVLLANPAARARMVEEGAEIDSLLATGQREYELLEGGCLHLTVCIAGQTWDASVTRMDPFRIFVLDCTSQAELNAMALAAQELRMPLSGVFATVSQLFPAIDVAQNPAAKSQMSAINRGLYQITRILGNMSDAARYEARTSSMELMDARSLIEETAANAVALCQDAGVTVTFANSVSATIMLIDREMLERAIYNLISNSLKFSSQGDTVAVQLKRRGRMLFLTVSDSGSGIPEDLRSSLFSRYRREPRLEDSRYGIGLGLVLVQKAATAHGGTVLVEHPAEGGTRVTMTMELRQNTAGQLRSPMLHIDYAGEQDHGLIELSDALPALCYSPERVK